MDISLSMWRYALHLACKTWTIVGDSSLDFIIFLDPTQKSLQEALTFFNTAFTVQKNKSSNIAQCSAPNTIQNLFNVK